MFEPVLYKPDLQKFIKRLRIHKERNYEGRQNRLDESWEKKYIGERWKWKNPIRYFAVGEYGEEFGRPHYHAIIFNVPEEMQVKGVAKAWGKGNIHVGTVTEASIHYVTKYALKKENFALMSRNPGIGYRYLDRDHIYKFHADKGNDFVELNGHKMSMPRYYKEKYIENRS